MRPVALASLLATAGCAPPTIEIGLPPVDGGETELLLANPDGANGPTQRIVIDFDDPAQAEFDLTDDRVEAWVFDETVEALGLDGYGPLPDGGSRIVTPRAMFRLADGAWTAIERSDWEQFVRFPRLDPQNECPDALRLELFASVDEPALYRRLAVLPDGRVAVSEGTRLYFLAENETATAASVALPFDLPEEIVDIAAGTRDGHAELLVAVGHDEPPASGGYATVRIDTRTASVGPERGAFSAARILADGTRYVGVRFFERDEIRPSLYRAGPADDHFSPVAGEVEIRGPNAVHAIVETGSDEFPLLVSTDANVWVVSETRGFVRHRLQNDGPSPNGTRARGIAYADGKFWAAGSAGYFVVTEFGAPFAETRPKYGSGLAACLSEKPGDAEEPYEFNRRYVDLAHVGRHFVFVLALCDALALYDRASRCVSPILRDGAAARLDPQDPFVDVEAAGDRVYALSVMGRVYVASLAELP